MKPDVVAPGELDRLGRHRPGPARPPVLNPAPGAPVPASLPDLRRAVGYVHGRTATSSGVIAAFLSAPAGVSSGRPEQVKSLLTQSTNRPGPGNGTHQGAGLVDLMRMLANV